MTYAEILLFCRSCPSCVTKCAAELRHPYLLYKEDTSSVSDDTSEADDNGPNHLYSLTSFQGIVQDEPVDPLDSGMSSQPRQLENFVEHHRSLLRLLQVEDLSPPTKPSVVSPPTIMNEEESSETLENVRP